jgi:glycerate 2-kinase
MTGRRRTALHGDARAIIAAALRAVEPDTVMAGLAGAKLPAFVAGGVAALAIGKAADAMLAAAHRHALAPLRTAFVVAPSPGAAASPDAPFPVTRWTGSHPLPDSSSARAARAAIAWLQRLPDDLPLLVLLSGGASALLALPAGNITVDELARTTSLLLHAGAPIEELNAVRREIDLVKGGRMAMHAGARQVLVLAISDVIGDRLDVIGSGPFYGTPPAPAGALEILDRRGVLERAPRRVVAHLEAAVVEAHDARSENSAAELDDGVRRGDAAVHTGEVAHRVVANNASAVGAAASEAQRRGYRIAQVRRPLCGEARDAGAWLARRGLAAWTGGRGPQGLVAGGETTVTVRGDGRGGRNQELALAAALEVAGKENVIVASIGTDGRDGPTDAAGAIVDGGTTARIAAAGLDARAALEQNDSYAALDAAGDLVRSGPTGTNVGDLQLVLLR